MAADEGHCRHLQRVKIQSTTEHVVWHTCIRTPTPKAQGPLQKTGLSPFAVAQMHPKRSSLRAYTSEQHLMDSSSYIYTHTHTCICATTIIKEGIVNLRGNRGTPILMLSNACDSGSTCFPVTISFAVLSLRNPIHSPCRFQWLSMNAQDKNKQNQQCRWGITSTDTFHACVHSEAGLDLQKASSRALPS